jgi:hypothetical protein
MAPSRAPTPARVWAKRSTGVRAGWDNGAVKRRKSGVPNRSSRNSHDVEPVARKELHPSRAVADRTLRKSLFKIVTPLRLMITSPCCSPSTIAI